MIISGSKKVRFWFKVLVVGTGVESVVLGWKRGENTFLVGQHGL